MCVYSMVMDHYLDKFQPWWPGGRPDYNPDPNPFSVDTLTQQDIAEIRQLIREMREALAAAKKVDRLTAQPDCEDPVKVELLERVAKLEKQLRRKPARKTKPKRSE